MKVQDILDAKGRKPRRVVNKSAVDLLTWLDAPDRYLIAGNYRAYYATTANGIISRAHWIGFMYLKDHYLIRYAGKCRPTRWCMFEYGIYRINPMGHKALAHPNSPWHHDGYEPTEIRYYEERENGEWEELPEPEWI